MKALYVAYYTILRNVRDYRNMTTMLALPIVWIFILGSALSGLFKIENIDPVKVILVNEDNGKLSEAFEGFLYNDDIKGIIKTEKIGDFDEGIDRLKLNEAAALIHIGRDFSSQIKVYKNDLSTFESSVVQNVVDSFIQTANAEYAFSKLGSKKPNIDFFYNIEEEALDADGNRPSSLDYYAIAMLAMTMMYGTGYGCSAMSEEQFHKTDIRLKSAPVASYQIYIGKILGTILTLMIDGVLIIIFTKYVYGVNWGSHIPSILFTCLSLAVLAAGFGVVSFMLIGDRSKTQAFLNLLVPLSTFLGGGYLPSKNLAPSIQKISVLSPNYLTKEVMLNIIFEGSYFRTFNYLSILWIASMVLFALSAFMGRRDLS